jgi:hypothetical protein
MKTQHNKSWGRKAKKYPMNGIPLRIQELRLRPRTAKEKFEVRSWVCDYQTRGDARPETVEAYTI